MRVAARSRWARLLARIYEVFPLNCPDCGGHMRILTFFTDPEPVDAILRHLNLPATPPPRARTRSYALQPKPWSRNDRCTGPTTDPAMAMGPYRHAAQGEDCH